MTSRRFDPASPLQEEGLLRGFRAFRDTLEKIARALIERKVLDANEIKMLVEGKELPPMPPPPSKPDDGVQHVIKPELQPGRAKGGERPATA